MGKSSFTSSDTKCSQANSRLRRKVSDNSTTFVALFSDGFAESQEAEELLRAHGFDPEVVCRASEDDRSYPLVVYRAWRYEGLDRIRALLEELDFEAKRISAPAKNEKRRNGSSQSA